MADGKRITRRAGLALIGAGVATAIPYTHGMTSTVANRLTNVETATDPNALLGIQGIGQSPREEIIVQNNGANQMTVTIQTTNFTIESPGSGTATTFALSPTATQTVTFSPENGQTDEVAVTGVVDDGSSQSATIQFTRSITIPVSSGATYGIRASHSDLYPTGQFPWDGGNVTQEPWQDSTQQQWTVRQTDGSYYIEMGAQWIRLALGEPASGNSFEEIVTEYSWNASEDRHRWQVVENPDGTSRIESVPTANDVLDVESASE